MRADIMGCLCEGLDSLEHGEERIVLKRILDEHHLERRHPQERSFSLTIPAQWAVVDLSLGADHFRRSSGV